MFDASRDIAFTWHSREYTPQTAQINPNYSADIAAAPVTAASLVRFAHVPLEVKIELYIHERTLRTTDRNVIAQEMRFSIIRC
jgi:hypothetical protein